MPPCLRLPWLLPAIFCVLFFFPVCSFSHSCTFKAGCVTFFFSFFLLSFVPCGCGCFDLFGLVFGRIWRWWWRICWSRSTAWTTRSRPASSSSVTAWARDSSARSFDSRHVLHSSAVRTYVRVIYNFVHGNRTWIGARNWKLGHGTTKHVCLLCRGGGGGVFRILIFDRRPIPWISAAFAYPGAFIVVFIRVVFTLNCFFYSISAVRPGSV